MLIGLLDTFPPLVGLLIALSVASLIIVFPVWLVIKYVADEPVSLFWFWLLMLVVLISVSIIIHKGGLNGLN